jgi:hypothetical protein
VRPQPHLQHQIGVQRVSDPRSRRAIADCVVPHSTASSCWDMPRARRVPATSRPTSANRRSWSRTSDSDRLRITSRICAEKLWR